MYVSRCPPPFVPAGCTHNFLEASAPGEKTFVPRPDHRRNHRQPPRAPATIGVGARGRPSGSKGTARRGTASPSTPGRRPGPAAGAPRGPGTSGGGVLTALYYLLIVLYKLRCENQCFKIPCAFPHRLSDISPPLPWGDRRPLGAGLLASGSDDGLVCVWDIAAPLRDGRRELPPKAPEAHPRRTTRLHADSLPTHYTPVGVMVKVKDDLPPPACPTRHQPAPPSRQPGCRWLMWWGKPASCMRHTVPLPTWLSTTEPWSRLSVPAVVRQRLGLGCNDVCCVFFVSPDRPERGRGGMHNRPPPPTASDCLAAGTPTSWRMWHGTRSPPPALPTGGGRRRAMGCDSFHLKICKRVWVARF